LAYSVEKVETGTSGILPMKFVNLIFFCFFSDCFVQSPS